MILSTTIIYAFKLNDVLIIKFKTEEDEEISLPFRRGTIQYNVILIKLGIPNNEEINYEIFQNKLCYLLKNDENDYSFYDFIEFTVELSDKQFITIEIPDHNVYRAHVINDIKSGKKYIVNKNGVKHGLTIELDENFESQFKFL
jgi:hypothetical protein